MIVEILKPILMDFKPGFISIFKPVGGKDHELPLGVLPKHECKPESWKGLSVRVTLGQLLNQLRY